MTQQSTMPPLVSHTLRSLCVFCGSSVGLRSEYAEAARELGTLLAARSIRLVTGAGHVGLMGVIADAALAGGGEVVGVIPQMLVDRELAHQGLTELRVVGSMHERKALMAELSDGFVALPGGLGTLEELCEVLTWAQLSIHHKPVGCLNTLGYFDPLFALLDHAVVEQFMQPQHRALLLSAGNPAELLTVLKRHSSGVEPPGRLRRCRSRLSRAPSRRSPASLAGKLHPSEDSTQHHVAGAPILAIGGLG